MKRCEMRGGECRCASARRSACEILNTEGGGKQLRIDTVPINKIAIQTRRYTNAHCALTFRFLRLRVAQRLLNWRTCSRVILSLAISHINRCSGCAA